MNARRTLLGAAALLASAFVVACSGVEPLEGRPSSAPNAAAVLPAPGLAAAPAATASAVASASPAKPAPKPVLPFLHDDVAGAMQRARAENKALFVDAWAPWCHTCLSMQNYVFTDPSLKPLADRAVFVAIDTDRPENAAFLEKHAVSVWPTFFVLDPQGDRIVGYWPGAASASEMRGFVDDSLHALDAMRGGKPGTDPGLAHLAAAREAHARRQYDRAASAYGQAVKTTPAGSSRRSEALLGWVKTLKVSGDTRRCAKVGREHIGEVTGAAIPADFAYAVLDCAEKLPRGSKEQSDTILAAVERLRALTTNPPADASPDDRADALSILADALLMTGDKAAARKANEARVNVMEKAAAEAANPQIAATYDYGRAMAYVATGRGEDAVRMLEQREKEMPDAYEPPARLADVLTQLGRHREALAAIERALPRAYGPRKLRYLKLRASLQGALRDRAGQLATLREEVAGYEALPAGMRSAEKLADAKARLREAERGGAP